jgi:hypothetical protein
MSSMKEIGAEIARSAGRLKAMQAAIADYDRRLADLEARRAGADAFEQHTIGREIGALTEQRLAARELLVEAERQASAAAQGYQRAIDGAIRDFGRISSACSSAATRFDRAIADAKAALAELIVEGDPLSGTLLPGKFGQRAGSNDTVLGALAFGFADLVRGRPFGAWPARTLSDSLHRILGDARANIAELKSRQKEAA